MKLKKYVKPAIIDMGNLSDLTRGGPSGSAYEWHDVTCSRCGKYLGHSYHGTYASGN